MKHRALEPLQALLDDFLARRSSFWDFHRRFIETYVRVPESRIAGAETDWHHIYQLVLTALPEQEEELRASITTLLEKAHEPGRAPGTRSRHPG